MSDLILASTALLAPPQACTEAPPTGSREDPCHLTIPLTDSDRPSGPITQVRFDRHGDQFVLSPSNSLDVREWFEAHDRVPEFYGTLRFFNGLLRNPRMSPTPASTHTLLLISEYIMTGNVEETTGSGVVSYDSLDLGRAFLDIFADTREDVLSPLLGQLQVVRRASWLSDEALERSRWVTSILDLVPQYRAFRRQFISDEDIEHYETLASARREALASILAFATQIVVGNGMHRPLRYDASFMQANDAYASVYGEAIAAGTREDFCTALERALRELRGLRGGVETGFLRECRQALEWRGIEPQEAFRRSLRQSLLSSENLRLMQEGIASESRQANMSLSWLTEHDSESSGGRVGEILELLFQHLQVNFPGSGTEDPNVTFDLPGFRLDFETTLDTHTATRREYVLAALALFRLLSQEDVLPSSVRVFVGQNFQRLAVPAELRASFQEVVRSLEARLRTSQDQSDIFLPILEGVTCALGIGGVALAETLPQIRDDSGLQLGIGTTGAGLAGAGCAAFLGHFIWPAVADVRNHYLWDGLTGLGGAVIGVAVYLLVHFLGGGGGPSPMDPGMRFPVDEYGP